MAGVILALRTSWSAFTAWQPQAETFTPANSAGQSLVLELDHPSVVNFSAAFTNSPEGRSSNLLAQVTVFSPSRSVYENLSVRANPTLGQIQVPLDGVHAGAGDEIVIELSDPQKEVLVGGTEHDSYPSGSRLLGGDTVGGDLAFRVVYRRSIGSLLIEGLGIALRSRRLVLAVVLTVGAAGLLVSGALRRLRVLDIAALTSVAISGGLLTTSMLGLAAAILRVRLTPGIVLLAALPQGLLGAWLWFKPMGLSIKLDFGAVGLVMCLLFFGALRLAFASPLTLPTHVDSVQHYLVVTDLLVPGRPPMAASTVGDFSLRYYHLGFHAMAAWVLALAGINTPYSLLVLGQIIQAGVIGAVYFPVYAAVKDSKAALAAVVLAGLGWSMPGYASNWAKYPAILGLAVLPIAVGLTLLALRANGFGKYLLLLISSFAVIGAALIHTRVLFLFAAFLLSIEVARRLHAFDLNRGFPVRSMIPIAIILLVAGTVILVSSPASLDSVRQSLRIFVDAQGGLSTLVVLLLTPLALRRHRTAALTAISWIAFFPLFELLPPNGSYPLPIIDAPLARMALFFPLCSLGGIAASGLESSLRSASLRQPLMDIVRGAVASGIVVYIGWSLGTQGYSPGDCCVLARQDDENVARAASVLLPPDSLVLIPSQASPDANAGPSPVDGGAWLFALSNRRTIEWPAEVDLASASQHSRLCSQRITHVYVGGTPWGFSREELDLAPAFYEPDLVQPRAAIYSVIGCS